MAQASDSQLLAAELTLIHIAKKDYDLIPFRRLELLPDFKGSLEAREDHTIIHNAAHGDDEGVCLER
jgi:hypothetical protein